MNELVAALLFRKLGGKGGFPEPTGSVDITKNGITDVKNYAEANVNVPNSYVASDEGKVVDNGTLVSQTSKNIVENGTHDTTKNNSVVVNVPNTYAAGDEGKVVDNGTLVSQTSKSVTENGTFDTTKNNSVVVNVPSSAGLKEYTSSALPKSTFKDWTTTFNAGNTLSVTLEPTDGTTVEVGDEVLVHGEITSSAGGFAYYVTGVVTSFDSSNKPVITVKGLGQPSPIADGALIASSNGSYNIKEYSNLTVNVQGSGTAYVTENGTWPISGYRYVNVNVESGGGDVKILFATDSTYQDQPVQGNSCSAEVLDIDLSSYSEGDKVVLYGVEPNYTDKNYLVVGTITSFSFPSVVYFDVDEVSEISGGGKGEVDIAVLISTMLDSDPNNTEESEVTPRDQSEISEIKVGDKVIVQGEADGNSFVFTGKVNANTGFTIVVTHRQITYHDGSNIYVDKGGSFGDKPSSGNQGQYSLGDQSLASEIQIGSRLICVGGHSEGGTYAAYAIVDVIDPEAGQLMLSYNLVDDFS